jgi:hypothetical protein
MSMRPVASVRMPIPIIEKESRARIVGFAKGKTLPSRDFAEVIDLISRSLHRNDLAS